MRLSLKPYDVFISYVVEDREIVEILYEELSRQGLKVWYANRELYPGSDIRSEIIKGLSLSRFGVAVITISYSGHWAYGELFYMMRERDVFIPVLHEISLDEVTRKHPEIAARFCLNTSTGVENTAIQIANHVRRRSSLGSFFSNSPFGSRKKARILGFSFLSILVLSMYLIFRSYSNGQPDETWLGEQVESRLANFESVVQKRIREDIAQNNAMLSSLNTVMRTEADYVGKTTKYRNYFDFFDGMAHITTQTGLKNAGIFQKDETISIPFGLTEYSIYLFKGDTNSSSGVGYSFVCLKPLSHQIKATRAGVDLYEVDVTYANCLRYAVVNVSIDTVNNRRISNHTLFGLKPGETFVFEKQGETWVLSLIR